MHRCHYWLRQLHQYQLGQRPRGYLEWPYYVGTGRWPRGHLGLEGWGRQRHDKAHDDSVRELGFQHRRQQCPVYQPHSLSCFWISGRQQLLHSQHSGRLRKDQTGTFPSFRTIRQGAWEAVRRCHGCCLSIRSRHRWGRNNHRTGSELSPQHRQLQLRSLYRI